MQAIVDHYGLFIDVFIGWPGKVHDARVYVDSSLYHKGMNCSLFSDWKKNICGVEVYIYMMSLMCHVNVHGVLPLVILEDPTYPALPWLMKPFQETVHTTTAQKTKQG